ncbi:hypothetical protein ACFVXQ_06245 [Kitasatospora sp. NPDC058263]
MERLGIPLPGRTATTLAAAVTVPDGRPPDAVDGVRAVLLFDARLSSAWLTLGCYLLLALTIGFAATRHYDHRGHTRSTHPHPGRRSAGRLWIDPASGPVDDRGLSPRTGPGRIVEAKMFECGATGVAGGFRECVVCVTTVDCCRWEMRSSTLGGPARVTLSRRA